MRPRSIVAGIDRDRRANSQIAKTPNPVISAIAAAHWEIPLQPAALGLLFAFAENQVAAAVRIVPLGQTAGQRILSACAATIERATARGLSLDDTEIGANAPARAIASALHETASEQEFSRLKLDDPAYITQRMVGAMAYAKRVEHGLAEQVARGSGGALLGVGAPRLARIEQAVLLDAIAAYVHSVVLDAAAVAKSPTRAVEAWMDRVAKLPSVADVAVAGPRALTAALATVMPLPAGAADGASDDRPSVWLCVADHPSAHVTPSAFGARWSRKQDLAKLSLDGLCGEGSRKRKRRRDEESVLEVGERKRHQPLA